MSGWRAACTPLVDHLTRQAGNVGALDVRVKRSCRPPVLSPNGDAVATHSETETLVDRVGGEDPHRAKTFIRVRSVVVALSRSPADGLDRERSVVVPPPMRTAAVSTARTIIRGVTVTCADQPLRCREGHARTNPGTVTTLQQASSQAGTG